MANPYAGTSLEGWAAAMQESDEAMDATLAACMYQEGSSDLLVVTNLPGARK